MLGALLYLIATIPYISHSSLLVLFVYPLFFRRRKLRCIFRTEKGMINSIIIFIGIAFVFFLIGSLDGDKQFEFPYFFPIIISFLIGASLEEKDLRVIVYLLLVESCVGIAEQLSGVVTFLPGVIESAEFADDELLYFRRAMGLCNAASTFSLHLLIGLMLLQYQRKNIPRYLLCSFLICLAIICTFNRTILIVAIPFEIYIIYCYINEHFSKVKYAKRLFSLAVFAGIVVVVYISYDLIVLQFTRGGMDNGLTGRPYIWGNYISFIKSHFFLGNCGYRTLLLYHGEPNHAHNSFLQIAANVGVPLALYYLMVLLMRVDKNNRQYIIPLFLASVTQYEIFWGISFADIILFYFLSYNVRGINRCRNRDLIRQK